MADRIIARGNNLDLNALQHAQGYVYLDDQNNLKVSQRRIRSGFLYLQTSSKHRTGFRRLQSLARQYGVNIQSNNSAYQVGQVHGLIANQQTQNKNQMRAMIQNAQTAHQDAGNAWDGFDNHMAQHVQQQIGNRLNTGVRLPNDVRDRIEASVRNRTERKAFLIKMEQNFGAQAALKFKQDTTNAFQNSEPLTARQKNVWNGYFAGKRQVERLVAELQAGYNGPGHVQACTVFRQQLVAKLDQMLQHPGSAPPHLTAGVPELPKQWIQDALDTAIEGAERAIDRDVETQKSNADDNRPVDEQQLRTNATRSKQALAGLKGAILSRHDLQSAARRVPVANAPRTSGQAIFQRSGDLDDKQFYAFCESVRDIDAGDFQRQAEVSQGQGNLSGAHLQEAKHLAALGLQLRDRGVEPAVAARMIRIEIAERRANRGAVNPAHWSGAMANDLADYQHFAQDLIQKEANSRIAPPERKRLVFDQLLQTEMSERQAGRNLNLRQWSPATQQLLANQQQGLKLIDQARITPSDMIAKLHEAADPNDTVQNFTLEEAVSCIQLSVRAQELNPQSQHLAARFPTNSFKQLYANELQQWTNAGFNRAEAAYYRKHFSVGDSQSLSAFVGSGLTAPEIRDVQQKFRANQFPLTRQTCPRHFVDRNRTSQPQRHGAGGNNTVYSADYRDIGGNSTRIFKRLLALKKWFGKVVSGGNQRREMQHNLATHALCKLFKSDVIVDTETCIQGNDVGISMAKAPGETARKFAQSRTFVVTADSRFAHLEKYREAISQDPSQGRKIAKRLSNQGISRLEIDPQTNELKVTVKTYRARTDDPVLQKKMMDLHILDYLVQASDRHELNYLIDVDDKGNVTSVKGIDNDKTFGTAGKRGFEMGLPPLIDTDQATRIRNLTVNDIRREVGPLVSAGDLQKLEQRLARLKNHVTQLEDDGRVIEPDEWGQPHITQALETGEYGNNYIRRDAIVGGHAMEGLRRNDLI